MNEKIEVILVDIGNTRIKSAVVVDGTLSEIKSWGSFQQLKDNYSSYTPMIICTTRSEKIERPNTTILSYKTPLPIKVNYETPETLGPDRIAAATGVYDLFPNRNSLVIDLGTCMTLDFVSSAGSFEGGIISPGLKMRMQSMSHFTSNLPDISDHFEEIEFRAMGKSTNQCLLAGAYGGMIREIEGTIARLKKDFTSINVILSGGDSHYFESRLKARIFAGSKIVLMGLHRVWKHQFP